MTCDVQPVVGPGAGWLRDPATGEATTMLVARCDGLALDQLGRLVILTRPEEWAGEPFGEWRAIDLERCNELEMREACWAVELLACAPANSISAENIVSAAHAFATGILLGMTLLTAQGDDIEP